MPWPCRRRLQLDDGASNPQPDGVAFMILPLPKLIRPLSGDDLGILAVLLDEQRGGMPDVHIGNHRMMITASFRR